MNTKEKEKYIEEFEFPHCDESSKYEKVAKIGQGTFGSVLGRLFVGYVASPESLSRYLALEGCFFSFFN